jgi:hypothetical protein
MAFVRIDLRAALSGGPADLIELLPLRNHPHALASTHPLPDSIRPFFDMVPTEYRIRVFKECKELPLRSSFSPDRSFEQAMWLPGGTCVVLCPDFVLPPDRAYAWNWPAGEPRMQDAYIVLQ